MNSTTAAAVPLLLSLLLAACGEPAAPPAPEPAADAATPPAAAKPPEPEKVELALRLRKGETYRMRCEADQDITQTMGGQEQKTHQVITIGMDFVVDDVDAAGVMDMTASIASMGMKMDGPMGAMEFDSAAPPDPVPLQFRPMLGLLGQPLKVRMTSGGTVESISGIGEALDHAMDSLHDEDDPLPPGVEEQLREGLKNQFGDEALKKMFSSASAYLPRKPVAVGDEWNWDLAMTAPFPMDLKSRYRLAAIGAEVVRIEVRGTVAPGPGDGILEMGPMRMKVELEGTQSGWFEMDRATGWTLKGEIDQDMKGTMIMFAPHGDGEDVEVPMSIRSKMKFMPAK